MTETTDPKRGVSLWVQVVIWVFVVALLLLVAVTLKKRQQGTVQPLSLIHISEPTRPY